MTVNNFRDRTDSPDLAEQSRKLFDYYEQAVDHAIDESLNEDTTENADKIYGASQWTLMWRKFRRNKIAIVGGLVILLYYIVALFGGFVAPYTLTQRFPDAIYMPPQRVHFFHNGSFQPHIKAIKADFDKDLRRIYVQDGDKIVPIKFFAKGASYKFLWLFEADIHFFQTEDGVIALLGTDRQGRDMFSRIVYGSQISLTVGLVGVAISLILGSVLGVVSGFYGGMVDYLIQRLIELVRSFPAIPLWMALSAAIPPHWPPLRSYFFVTLILSIIGWTWLARQLRGQVLTLRGEEYITAARLAGASNVRIIFRHLIPATLSQIIVVSTLAMPAMIIAETALSYLGLGLRPPVTSWGVLLKEVQDLHSIALYPWVFTPALAIAMAILAFNFLGDGLRDAADPYAS